MLPQSIIVQTNKFLLRNGKQEWDVSETTTGKQFYEFFKTAIKVAHRQQTIFMGHDTEVSTKTTADRVCIANNEKVLADTSTINSVEKVFLIKHAETQEDETKEEQINSSSPKTIVNENKDTKCKFCEAIESLHL